MAPGPQLNKTRHVIFIGETGSGKSSVINLIAGRNCAVVSPDASPCTRDFASYEVSMGSRTYMLWDTPGLNPPSHRKDRLSSLTNFLQRKYSINNLDLLVLCIKGNRDNKVTSQTYETFCRATRDFGIPVVIAKTHLEKMGSNMEKWWGTNDQSLSGLVVDGHACLTSLPQPKTDAERQLVEGSRQRICDLICAVVSRDDWQIAPQPGRKYLDNPKKCIII